MSVIPWNKIDSNSSPFVTMFSLIGLPFAAGLVNFVVLTAAASQQTVVFILIVVFYSDLLNKV